MKFTAFTVILGAYMAIAAASPTPRYRPPLSAEHASDGLIDTQRDDEEGIVARLPQINGDGLTDTQRDDEEGIVDRLPHLNVEHSFDGLTDTQRDDEEANVGDAQQPGKDKEDTSDGDDEIPMYGNEKRKQIIKKKDPLPPPDVLDATYAQLKDFLQEVVVLLVTINENEIWSALHYMEPPESGDGKPIISDTRPINFFDVPLNAMLTLGMFGGHKTALIQAKMGDDCRQEIENALELLPNAQLVAGVGVAYGRKDKTMLGDVMVATTIDGVGNVRWDNGKLLFYQGDNRYTRTEQRAIEVFAREVDDWSTTTGFKVTKGGRVPEIHPKMIVSAPWLVNDLDILNKIMAIDPRAVGGEMEGQVLSGIHNDFLNRNPPRKIDTIIIKGVADFADGSKHKGWQMTAGLASIGYTKFKLEETGGQVYKLPAASKVNPQPASINAMHSSKAQDLIMKLMKKKYE